MPKIEASVAILALRTVLPALESEGGFAPLWEILESVAHRLGGDRSLARECIAAAVQLDVVEKDGAFVSL